MHAEVLHVKGLTFLGRASSSNSWVPIDTTVELGGHDSGTKPLEMVLVALGGCTGMDVVSILRKMRVQYDEFRIDIEAKRTEEHPRVFSEVNVEYTFIGTEIPDDKVKKAIDLSMERYCPVTAMLRKTCPVDYSYKIEEPA